MTSGKSICKISKHFYTRILIVMKIILITILLGCSFGLTKLQRSPEFLFYNYNGAKRSYCPLSEHIGNQPVNRKDTSLRLRQLRSEMVRVASIETAPLHGYIVTSDDEHQSETVDPRDMRREFLTGFYGSAGDAVVTLAKAVLWTDGRYHLQADLELDCNWILMKRGRKPIPTITEWLKHEFQNRPNIRIGADPKLVPAAIWEAWERDLVNTSINLVAVRKNLVDLIWQVGRPNYNSYAAYPLKNEYAGKSWQEKIKDIRLEMSLVEADALVVTALDEIAWLFNIRGYDLPHTPVLRSYVIVTQGSLHLYASKHKLLRSVDTHLKMDSCFHADCVKWHNETCIWDDLRTMSQAWKKIWLPTPCGYAQGASKEIYSSIPAEKRLPKASPIIDLRAVKNEIEAEGMRKAHIRDGMAMCDFLAYMEEQISLNSEGWDEMQVSRVVNEFRLEQEFNKGISFATIAAYGAHAALPHYEPINLTNIPIGKTSMLVVDSGGQYLDGTTDVTRTLHFGEPTEEQKKAYTRVLIGSIQLSSLIFPDDLMTDQIDVLARRSLWSTGNDYMHGTGHGIGHFSSVHESPISISYTGGMSVTLKPGFFLSNEPGFYKKGDFGVRLENILEVVTTNISKTTGQTFLKFRDVTLVPYEPKLIDFNMLTPMHCPLISDIHTSNDVQRRWLNNYNQRIREEVGRELKKHLRMKGFYWMMDKTKDIPEWGKVNKDILLARSHSNSSTFKEIHVLVTITIIYNIILNFATIYS
ncbi:xaa-Pro aminopeptidase 1 isoform X2 [Vespa velutina]|uniref:xaa-Pro aminopeptidase 1 isoform X2 n=1 Tax=Vespa velutina TaxID=202808 RepID=UPI001FB4D4A0|nr:xaa-Pro aminopeptidase 1 isoform X2 [Vespa velutina]